MQIKKDANLIASKELQRNNVVAAYKSTKEAIKRNYRHNFVASLQMYVTKIGIILSHCVSGIELLHGTFLGTLDYICLKVLKNPQLYKLMRAVSINDTGNNMKHTINDINIDIDLVLDEYNKMISSIVKTTGITAFKKCYLNREKNGRDVPIVDEKRHHKYFEVDGFKMQLKISPNYTVDQYSKSLCGKITLYWPEGVPGYYADIDIVNNRTKRKMSSAAKIDLGSDNSKKAFTFNCKENDLNRRVLYLSVKIKLYRIERDSYTTGALFWKNKHYCSNYIEVGAKTEELSQYFQAKR